MKKLFKQSLIILITILTLSFTHLEVLKLNKSKATTASTLLTIYRLYSPANTRHYYTTATSGPEYSIYTTNEGALGSILSAVEGSSDAPLYVLINTSGDRILTINTAEKNSLMNAGFIYQGIMGYVAQSYSPLQRVSIYRYYNPSKQEHFYTNNYNELGSGRYGYGYEGVAFSLIK